MEIPLSNTKIMIPFIKGMLNGLLDLERMWFIGMFDIEEIGKVKLMIVVGHFLLNNIFTVIVCFKLQYFLNDWGLK